MSIRSLKDEQLNELRCLFSSGNYKKIDLAKKYNCSITTIALWLPLSNKDRYKKFKSGLSCKLCYKCNEPTKTHKRCNNCTILLHDKPCDCI